MNISTRISLPHDQRISKKKGDLEYVGRIFMCVYRWVFESMHRKGFLLAAEQVVLARASTWELHSQRSSHHLKRSNIFSSILCNFYWILDFHQTIFHQYSLVLFIKVLSYDSSEVVGCQWDVYCICPRPERPRWYLLSFSTFKFFFCTCLLLCHVSSYKGSAWKGRGQWESLGETLRCSQLLLWS